MTRIWKHGSSTARSSEPTSTRPAPQKTPPQALERSRGRAEHQEGAEAVIPPRNNRTEHRAYDRPVYNDRNLAERFFNRLKQFRRMATRDDTLARNFVSLLTFVCAYIWLSYLCTGS